MLSEWSDDFLAPVCASSAAVLEFLKTFPQTSSPGFSVLRAELLLDSVLGTALDARECLVNLTRWVSVCLSGHIDPRISLLLFGTPLIALVKKNGDGFRPIAVGKVLCRFVSQVVRSAIKSKLLDLLLPYGQVGVGIPGGLEAAFYSLKNIFLVMLMILIFVVERLTWQTH